MKNERFLKVGDEVVNGLIELRNECEDYLRRMLINTKQITWEESFLAIVYDGGNHPEYSADPYSLVKGIGVNENGMYAILEDEDEYQFERIETLDLYNIATYVYSLNV